MDIGVSLVDPSDHECGEASGSEDDRQNSIPFCVPSPTDVVLILFETYPSTTRNNWMRL